MAVAFRSVQWALSLVVLFAGTPFSAGEVTVIDVGSPGDEVYAGEGVLPSRGPASAVDDPDGRPRHVPLDGQTSLRCGCRSSRNARTRSR